METTSKASGLAGGSGACARATPQVSRAVVTILGITFVLGGMVRLGSRVSGEDGRKQGSEAVENRRLWQVLRLRAKALCSGWCWLHSIPAHFSLLRRHLEQSNAVSRYDVMPPLLGVKVSSS